MRGAIAIWCGGAVGTAVRYELGVSVHQSPGSFPWATFGVNVAGSFLVGALMIAILERWPPTRYARLLGGVGFCGGLTTFSGLAVDAALLVRDDAWGVAAWYLAASIGCGLVAVYVGTALVGVRRRGGVT